MENVLIKTFLNGIAYFFASGRNPILLQSKQKNSFDIADSMKQDWFKIGNDLRNAFEKYKIQCR